MVKRASIKRRKAVLYKKILSRQLLLSPDLQDLLSSLKRFLITAQKLNNPLYLDLPKLTLIYTKLQRLTSRRPLPPHILRKLIQTNR
jgi:hypothetical protein